MSEPMKKCPFCGGKVRPHPDLIYSRTYYAAYHKRGCWLILNHSSDSVPDELLFTLIPKTKNGIITWNTRAKEE